MVMTSSDDQLMKSIAKGDHDAFRKLFDRHCDYVFGYAVRLLGGDRLKAEDISQIVWMKVIESSAGFQSKEAFVSWIGSITRNTVFNHYRHLTRHPEHLISEAEAGVLVDGAASVEDLLISQHTVESVRSAIDSLPDSQRVVMVMWMTEEVSYEELGKAFNMTVSSVKSLLFRARQNLEKKLRDGLS